MSKDVEWVANKAKELVRTTQRPVDATYYLIGLLAIRLEAERTEGTPDWSSIASDPSFDKVRQVVGDLRGTEDTAQLAEALEVLGLTHDDAFQGGARYGRSSMQDNTSEDILKQFVRLADQVHRDNLSDHDLTHLVDTTLDVAASYSGTSEGEHYTPRRLSALIADILDPEEGSSIYDPATGTGGMLLNLREKATGREGSQGEPELYGQEINQRVAALATVNMWLHDADADLVVGDSLMNPSHTSGASVSTFDYVAANPPIRLNIDSGVQENLRNDPYDRFNPSSINGTADIAFVQHVAACLGPQGRGVMVVSPSLLQASGRERKGLYSLLEDDLIEAVISLPGGMLNYTDIPISLLVLNRAKAEERSGKIMAVEVSSYEDDDSLSTGQKRRILASVNQFAEIDRFSAIVSRDTVLENEDTLGPARYVSAEATSELLGGLGETKKLGEIASVHRGNRLSRSADGDLPFVKAADIRGYRVHLDDLEDVAHRDTIQDAADQLTTCKTDDILAGATAPFNAAIAGEGLEGVPVNQEVVLIRLHEDYQKLRRFLPEFIRSDTGYRLLSSFSSGVRTPRLRVDQLRELSVPVPNGSFLSLIEGLHEVEGELESRRQRVKELRQQLFDMKDPQRSEAHVRELSSSIQVLADSLVQADDTAYKIQNFYPFPIAWGYRSLLSIQEESTRREELKRAAENLLAFLACVGLAVAKHETGLPAEEGVLNKAWLQTRFRGGVTFGDWQKIAFRAAKQLRSDGCSDLASEYASIWFASSSGGRTSDFYNMTEELVSMRNIDSHGRETTPVERRERANEFQRMVDAGYEAVSFLVKYPLHLVTEINQPFGEDHFEVSSLEYVGDHPRMKTQETVLSDPVSKDILYIESGSDGWIPLHPWISVTFCPECKTRETFLVDRGDPQDGTYRFRGFENGHALHDSSDRTRIVDHLQKILSL